MKHLIITTVLFLMMATPSLAATPRKHKDCECDEQGCIDSCKACDKCRACIKREIRKKIKERAAEEAKRRKDRIHRSKIKPRIIIIFGNGGINQYRHHPNCRCNRCWWSVRYRPRRQVDVFINVHPRAHAHHDRHNRKRVDNRRKLWYDGLRTRTDRPTFRR